MTLFVQIDDVILSGFEIPQELGDIGGKQTLVKHEFPGGLITIKPLGAFPHPITWSGILTGTDAFARSQKLDRIRAVGNEVTLSYGQFAWSGYVASFHAKPKHQWFVPYTITFEPTVDLSGVGTIPFSLIDADSLLSGQVDSVNSLLNGDDGLPLPANLAIDATALLDAVSAGLLNGDGTVAGIQSSDQQAIAVAAAQTEADSLPYSLGTDPTQASPALDLSVAATAISQIVGNPVTGVRVIQVINPNIFALAQRYYGDVSLWQQITDASGLPPDPQPTGQFTLTVPMS